MSDSQYIQAPSYAPQAEARTPDDVQMEREPGQSARAQSAEMHALLGPVQADAASDLAADQVKQHAARGFSGQGQQLPHVDAIQRAFGQHAVNEVQAFVGGSAAAASQAMGARAYTSGGKVAFGSTPDLHTAAHEAAHVVQQRAGVSLSGGVGRCGDAYERHADRVADAVVAGNSAESLLDQAGDMSSASGAEAVQRKEESAAPKDEKTGKELWVKRSMLGFTYHHAGVHIGDDQVVHVFAEPLQALKDMLAGEPVVEVRKTSYSTFKDGGSVTVGPSSQAYNEEDASIRAQSLVGLPWSYDPLGKNCQHFSSEMVSGSAISPEANSIKDAFDAVLEALGKPGKALAKGAKKIGGWIKKAGKGLMSKVKGWFS